MAHRCGNMIPRCFAAANHAASSKAARFICHRQRIAAFPTMKPLDESNR